MVVFLLDKLITIYQRGEIDMKKKVSIASLLVALGIVYGDIGTYPLYVVKSLIGG